MIWDKQFLIFLFFLMLSGSFWLLQALDEEYEITMSTELQLHDVPRNVVITTDLPSSVQFTLRDKGSTLLGYLYGRRFPAIVINFHNVANKSGHVRLPVADLLKQVNSRLSPSTRLSTARTDTVEFFFNYGLSKRIPVRLSNRLRAAKEYYISSVRLIPDSVTVYAARTQLDTIHVAYTQPIGYGGLTDSVRFHLRLQPIYGAKLAPTRTLVEVNVDRLTEKTVQVPVHQANFPATKMLRTFPSKVNVTFQIGAENYRHITADDFTLVVNYEDLIGDTSGRCRLELHSLPQGVSHVRIVPQEIDYLIEDIPEE